MRSRILIPGNPGSKQRHRPSRRGKGFIAPDRQAEQAVGWQMRAQYAGKPIAGAVGVQMRFYRGDRYGVDYDNLAKRVGDAGNQILWRDDRQIVEAHIYLVRGSDDPRTELEFWGIEG